MFAPFATVAPDGQFYFSHRTIIYLQNNILSSQIIVDILYTSIVIYSAVGKHLAEVNTVSIR